jgi:transcriptional regulator with XRE-family HTH domain
MAQAMNHHPWVPAVETFGDRLVLLRRHLGITQVQAAKQCGLDDGSWSNWEKGASPRNMARVVRKIHEATGVDMAWLMWGSMPDDGGSAALTPKGGDTPPDQQLAPSRCTARVLALGAAA